MPAAQLSQRIERAHVTPPSPKGRRQLAVVSFLLCRQHANFDVSRNEQQAREGGVECFRSCVHDDLKSADVKARRQSESFARFGARRRLALCCEAFGVGAVAVTLPEFHAISSGRVCTLYPCCAFRRTFCIYPFCLCPPCRNPSSCRRIGEGIRCCLCCECTQ